MVGETTEKFDAIRCNDEGRYFECEFLHRNKIVDDHAVEEINIKDMNSGNALVRQNSQAYGDSVTYVFDEPTRGVVQPQGSSLDVEL